MREYNEIYVTQNLKKLILRLINGQKPNSNGNQKKKPNGKKKPIPNGGWKNYHYSGVKNRTRFPFTDVYRSYCGKYYFKFKFIPKDGYYEIEILSMPSYNKRPTDSVSTHRLQSISGKSRICFGDPTVAKNPKLARKWAKSWSEHTIIYIKTGKTF